MSQLQPHEDDNLRVFRAFAPASGLEIEPASIRCAQPPHPDIVCEVAGRPHYFELARAVNEGLVRLNVDLHRRASREGGAHDFTTPDPLAFLEMPLAKKAAKTYVADGPIDLLLWLDRTKDHLGFATVDAMPHAVEHTLRRFAAQWHEVWLFDPVATRILARVQPY